MYNIKEAQKIFKYYSDKVVGKPIKKAEEYLIDYLDIVELENNTFNVFCYCRGSISVDLFRNINSVAKDLGLMSPSEVLEQ